MINIFKPAVNLMAKLKYANKFILLGLLVVFVVGLQAYQLIGASTGLISFTQQELIGEKYINALIPLMKASQNYRQAQIAYMSGDPNYNLASVMNAQAKVRDAVDKANHVNQLYGTDLSVDSDWTNLQNTLSALKTNTNMKTSVSAQFDMDTGVITSIQGLIVKIADSSNLTLDPDTDTYYLMDSYVIQLPGLIEQLSQMRDLGNSVLIAKTLSGPDNDKLLLMTAFTGQFESSLSSDLGKVLNASPFLADNLSLAPSLVKDTNNLIDLLNSGVKSGKFLESPADFSNQYNAVIDKGYKLNNDIEQSLDMRLHDRINGLHKTLYSNLALASVSVLIVGYLFIGLYLSISRAVKNLAEQSDKLTAGDLGARLDVVGRDELAHASERFNSMINTLADVMKETQSVVNAAGQGDLSKEIDIERKLGFARELGNVVNNVLATNKKVIEQTVSVMDILSKGNLSVRIVEKYMGIFGQLRDCTNAMIDQLEHLISQVKQVITIVYSASHEISAGSTELSHRTEEQATALEKTAASMEEITTTVKQTAENTKKASELASAAKEVASHSGEVVKQTVIKMGTINESSRKIVDIISVIDGIAFQTNLLALNAAVEAARAGEQGRGFTVVATEVRNLAQRAAAAAKEIKALITNSVEAIETGTQLVNETGVTMDKVVDSVQQVTGIINEIAVAATEQSIGIEQINQAIAELDDVTQHNVALVEETATAAESLEAEIKRLDDLTQLFTISGAKEKPKNYEPLKHTEEKKALKHATKDKKQGWEEF